MNEEHVRRLVEETCRTTLLEFSTHRVDFNIIDDKKKRTIASIPVEFCEKFAELIVNECVDACLVAGGTRWMAPPTQDQIVLDCVREIRLRFGIE
jgi:hypothetical protein